jgi:hypothetical protein
MRRKLVRTEATACCERKGIDAGMAHAKNGARLGQLHES